MAKGNGTTRAGNAESPMALSGPALWEARRKEAPAEISKALQDGGFNTRVTDSGRVEIGRNFYDGDKPVRVEASVDLFNAEDKNYIVYGTKVKTLDSYQVTNDNGRGKIAIGTKEYTRKKKLSGIYDTLPEVVEAIQKFTKKF